MMSPFGEMHFILAVLLCSLSVLTSPILERQSSQIAGMGKYGCTYDLQPVNMQVGFSIVKNFGPATSFDDCVTQCDNEPTCVAASYHPLRADHACIRVSTLSYSNATLRMAKHAGVQTVKVVAGSCNKPGATVIPLGCSIPAGTNEILQPIGSQYGCLYNVTCGVQIAPNMPTVYSQTSTFGSCLAICDNNEDCYAATYFQGGDCYMATNYGFMNATYVPPDGNDAESARIVQGSCSKRAAN